MTTKERLNEALAILDEMLSRPKCHKGLVRVYDLIKLVSFDVSLAPEDAALATRMYLDEAPF